MIPRISITTIDDQEEASIALWAQTEQNLQGVRQRAFDYFQQRGQLFGDDWADFDRESSARC